MDTKTNTRNGCWCCYCCFRQLPVTFLKIQNKTNKLVSSNAVAQLCVIFFPNVQCFFFHVLLFVFYSIAIYVWSRKNTILWINQIQIIEQTKFHLPLTIFCACCEGLLSYCILFYFFFVFFSFDSMWPRICGLECTFVHKKAHNQPIYYTIHNKQAN